MWRVHYCTARTHQDKSPQVRLDFNALLTSASTYAVPAPVAKIVNVTIFTAAAIELA
jgi:hypothetical protein